MLLLGAVTSIACRADSPALKPAERLVVADVILTVDNQSRRPARVSLEWDRVETALGEVPRNATRSFSLPSEARAGLRLKAVQYGARRFAPTSSRCGAARKWCGPSGRAGRGRW